MYESNSEYDPSLLRRLTGHRGEITGLSFHPNSTQLVSSSTDTNLILWNLKKHAHAIKFESHSDQVTDVCFLHNAKAFASSSKDRTLRLWTPSIKHKRKVITAHTSSVRSVHISSDDSHLLSASNDKNIKMWMCEYNNKFISTFKGHTHWVNSARFSFDGKHVISCSDDKTVKLWDRHTNCLIHSFEEKVVPKYVEFHPNNKCFGVTFANGHIKIYDLRNHKLLQFYAHKQSVNKLAFHPNGNFFITGSSDGLVNVYDIVEGRIIYTLEGHDGSVKALAFSLDGEHFATGAEKTIFVWKTNFNCSLAKPLETGSRTVDARQSMTPDQPNYELEVSYLQDSPTEENPLEFESSPKEETFYSVVADNNQNLPVTNENTRSQLQFVDLSDDTFQSCNTEKSLSNAGGDATAKKIDTSSDVEKVMRRVNALKAEVKSLQSELGGILQDLEAIEIRQKNSLNS